MTCFSVVIPSYNRAEYLSAALHSVLCQEDAAFEVLVVDDGSTDKTAEVVGAYDSQAVRYIYQEHKGAPAARNLGIKEAKGSYLVWLDSDDMLMPAILSKYKQNIERFPEIGVWYGDLVIMTREQIDGSLLPYEDWRGREKEILGAMVFHNVLPHGGSVVHKNCYRRHGMYNEEFPRAHDYELWSRFAGKEQFGHVQTATCVCRWHGTNISSGRKGIDRCQEREIVKKILRSSDVSTLYPEVVFRDEQQAAGLYQRIARRFLNLGDEEEAYRYIRESYKRHPNRTNASMMTALAPQASS